MAMADSALGGTSGIQERRDFQCPNCGSWDSEGGCEDLEQCIEALAKREDLYITEIGNLLHTSNTRPFSFLVAGLDALDLLNIGLAVTDVSGRVSLTNETARQILETRDGLELSSDGVLRTLRRCNPPLSDVIQQVAGAVLSGRPETNEAVIAVQRPSDKRPLTLLVRSAKRTNADPDGPATLVFILDPELSADLDEAALRQLYGLTSAETRLATLLMEGKTLDDCCFELGIRRSTARTHLQHLFEKAGVQRQSELVFVLLKSVGLVRRRSEERGTCTLRFESFLNAHTKNLLTKARRASSDLF